MDGKKERFTDDNKEIYTDDNKEIYTDDNKEIFTDDNKEIFTDDNKEIFTDGERELSVQIPESTCSQTKGNTDSAVEASDQNAEMARRLLGFERVITAEDSGEMGASIRKRILTDKGKQYELDKLKEARVSALRQVTREINKLDPMLQDFNNFEFVSSEVEVLNGLIAKLHDAHDEYLNSLEDTVETRNAAKWFEVHDNDIFKFKQILCEYISKAKCQIYEMKSITSKGSRRSSQNSGRSRRSDSSTISSKSRLIEARAKVAELEVEAKYLKETQALRMASEELKLKKVLAQAKKAEQIYEQASNDDTLPMPASVLEPNNRNVSFNRPVPTDTSSAPIPGSINENSTNVSAMFGSHYRTIPTVTSSASLEAAYNTIASSANFVRTPYGFTSHGNSNLRATQEVINTTPSNLIAVSSLPTPIISTRTQSAETERTLHGVPTGSSMTDPTPRNTTSCTRTTYCAPTEANSQLVGGEVPNDPSQPLQYPNVIVAGSVPTHSHCAQDNTYHELIDLQRKQTELSKTIVSQQARSLLPAHKPPMFAGEALEFPTFWTAFESLIESKVEDPIERLYFLGQYTVGKAKEVIKGCLQRKTSDAYNEAKHLLQRQFGDPFKIASAHVTRLSSWPQIKPNEGSALRNFAIALEQAGSAMKGMSHMQDLNTAHVLRKLWEKLPRYLRSKWTERNSKTKTTKGRMANFEEFSQFVCEQAELATDPIFSEEGVSKISLEDKDNYNGKSRLPKRVRGFGTVTGGAATVCPLCKRTHDLNDCEQFLKKPLSDRRDFVKENKLCYGCFSNQHIAKNCKGRQTCKTCNKKHPTSMHDENWARKAKAGGEKEDDQSPGGPQVTSNRTAVCNITEAGDVPVNMGIIPVWVSHKSNPTNKEKVYALLDNASGGTFMREDLAQRLNVEGSSTNLILTTMHGSENVSTKAIDGLIVTNLSDEDVTVELPRTYTRKVIPADHSEIPRPDEVKKIPHLRKVSEEMPPFMEDVDVGLLIGLNCPRVLRPREIIFGKETEPYAIRSLLGWYINGPSHASENHSLHCNRIQLRENAPTTAKGYVVSQTKIKEQITPLSVKRMFELDFSEIEKGTAMSREDARFYQIVEDGIVHLEDQHYEMPLPLKDPNIKLPNNYVQAEKRLNSLKKRLLSDEKYRKDYCNFMSEIISKGYAREVDDDVETANGKIWYLPHHGVYHAQKPDKVRVVFDCSAKYEGKSLNENLLQGPDLTSNLIGVLTRFRQEKFAFMADIEKMFFQVKVRKEDQNLLRFLWWTDGNMENKPKEYCMTVHLFGAGSSPACANFALRRTADDNESEYGVTVADTLRKNFYVDDVLKSSPTEDEAVDLSKKVKEACAKGGFNLTKFVGNTERIINQTSQEHRAENVKNLSLGRDKLPMERVLGVHWCIESDVFKFRIQLKDNPCTRRGILSTISSIYDPLGFIAPVVLVGKRILQEICQASSWDEPVDDATRNKWEKWRGELYLLERLDVPRSFKPKEFGKVVSVQLHSMSDASTTGYGQCSYLRLKDENGKVYTSFVMGKARVTPRKSVSIPRLELAAATTSVKVAGTLKEELEYDGIEDHYWTDSKVVLGYISNESGPSNPGSLRSLTMALRKNNVKSGGRRIERNVSERLHREIEMDRGPRVSERVRRRVAKGRRIGGQLGSASTRRKERESKLAGNKRGIQWHTRQVKKILHVAES